MIKRTLQLLGVLLLLLGSGARTGEARIDPGMSPWRETSSSDGFMPDSAIRNMIDQVQTATVAGLIGDLSGENPVMVGDQTVTLTSRYTLNLPAIERATQYVYEHFQSLGLPVEYQNYTLFSYPQRNVIAEQTGTRFPERIFLITAHLDDVPSSGEAPGADDNASGSASVLTAAQVLSRYKFGCTLRYALFTGEELGLYGSKAYAADLEAKGENVAGVLNLDMIGYNSDTQPVLDLHARYSSNDDLAIAESFVDVVEGYRLNLQPRILRDGACCSDHVSFWGKGFPAILAIEHDDDFTPYYHSKDDKLSTLDPIYFTDFVKAAVGTLAHMGCYPVDCTPLTAADFSYSPAIPTLDESVTFSAAVDGAASGPVTLSWDFGDGGQAAGESASHAFPMAARDKAYTVRLTAKNGCSLAKIATHTITVSALKTYLPQVMR